MLIKSSRKHDGGKLIRLLDPQLLYALCSDGFNIDSHLSCPGRLHGKRDVWGGGEIRCMHEVYMLSWFARIERSLEVSATYGNGCCAVWLNVRHSECLMWWKRHPIHAHPKAIVIRCICSTHSSMIRQSTKWKCEMSSVVSWETKWRQRKLPKGAGRRRGLDFGQKVRRDNCNTICALYAIVISTPFALGRNRTKSGFDLWCRALCSLTTI